MKNTLAAAIALLLIGCGVSSVTPPSSQASPTSSDLVTPSPTQSTPSASVGASLRPDPSPSASSGGTAQPTLQMLESTVDGLRLRSGPGLAAAGFVFPCNPFGGCTQPVVIEAGWTVVALAGPVAADGYDWYLVQLTPEHPGSAHLGWAATPQTGDDWLVATQYQCPPGPPDAAEAIAMGALRLLYCYGDEELSFDGYVVTGFGCNVMGTFEPAWLAHPCANMSYISPVQGSNDDIFLHYPAPGVVNPTLELADGQGVRIQGHFDDAAAASCVMEDASEGEIDAAAAFTATDPAADIARCRLRFVVTEVSVAQ